MASIKTVGKARVTLLTNANATGSWQPVTAGRFQWAVWGDFNTQVPTLQWSPDGGTTAIQVAVLGIARAKVQTVELGEGHVRVSFGAAPTSVSSDLRMLPR